ncbi:MAG: glycosyltransferase family 4 protein [Candidatus Delongbacteria bacterium]|nr:glycosyltransferase family 4 protein [Candidatus Delongbacteria bacterium]
MKILIVSTSDIEGGAAKAAYRLHKALIEHGVDSKMLVQSKKSDDFTVITLTSQMMKKLTKNYPILTSFFENSKSFYRSIFDSVPILLYKNRSKTIFSPSWLPFSGFINRINEIKPDIVHLHWVCAGMFRIEDLKKIKVPLVLSMHDNWAYTGGCHIKWECEKYKNSCGACPRLGSKKENDISRKIWKRKQKIFKTIPKMIIVGLSSWIFNCASKSSLFKESKIVNLPNLIDTKIFKVYDKNIARDLWNLAKDKKFILFGAMSATSDINKGYKQLYESLKLIQNNDVELVIFGSSKPNDDENHSFPTHYLGQLNDEISLLTIYNAVDLTVVPSLEENLSNVIMESLSCGTPVVAFDIGGNSDLVEHRRNGYLANPYDCEDLARGIDWVLCNSNYQELAKNARDKVLKYFDSKLVVEKYIKLYKELLEKQSD